MSACLSANKWVRCTETAVQKCQRYVWDKETAVLRRALAVLWGFFLLSFCICLKISISIRWVNKIVQILHLNQELFDQIMSKEIFQISAYVPIIGFIHSPSHCLRLYVSRRTLGMKPIFSDTVSPPFFFSSQQTCNLRPVYTTLHPNTASSIELYSRAIIKRKNSLERPFIGSVSIQFCINKAPFGSFSLILEHCVGCPPPLFFLLLFLPHAITAT